VVPRSLQLQFSKITSPKRLDTTSTRTRRTESWLVPRAPNVRRQYPSAHRPCRTPANGFAFLKTGPALRDGTTTRCSMESPESTPVPRSRGARLPTIIALAFPNYVNGDTAYHVFVRCRFDLRTGLEVGEDMPSEFRSSGSIFGTLIQKRRGWRRVSLATSAF